MKISLLLLSATLLNISMLHAAPPFRGNTPLEDLLAPAKADFYRKYDTIEAHFKFAGALLSNGCLEAAFLNTENLLRTLPSPQSRDFFARHAQRRLTALIPAEPVAVSDAKQLAQKRQESLIKQAKTDPAAAAFLRFAGNPEQWNSSNPREIARTKVQIQNANKDKKLSSLLEFNTISADYLYIVAKDYEAALPYFIKLYFHDPEHRTKLQMPLGFVINQILRRITPSRRSSAEILSRHDPVKLILDNLHLQPQTVENFLRINRSKLQPDKFLKLCLLASDSAATSLRSFACTELMRRDLRVLLPLFDSLLHDPDPGRQATAVLLMPFVFTAGELPEKLAYFARSSNAVIRMNAVLTAKNHCREENFIRFKQLAEPQQ